MSTTTYFNGSTNCQSFKREASVSSTLILIYFLIGTFLLTPLSYLNKFLLAISVTRFDKILKVLGLFLRVCIVFGKKLEPTSAILMLFGKFSLM